MSTHSRRRFIGLAGLAGASAFLGLPASAAWAARGAKAGRLRLAFFTDVHATPEWGAPEALDIAAAAINRRRPELVIGGGDLIYDAFETTAAAAEPLWDAYLEMHRSIAAPLTAVIGNHDLTAVNPADGSPPAADPRQLFRRKLGLERTWRSIDAEGYRILLLDSVRISSTNPRRMLFRGKLTDLTNS